MNTQREENFNHALGLRFMTLCQRRNISQHGLGNLIGVSGQQIQKYENSVNRITAEKLLICTRAPNVHIGYFYGEEERPRHAVKSHTYGLACDIARLHPDIQNTLTYHVKIINRVFNAANDTQG